MGTVGADLRVRPHPQGALSKIRMVSFVANNIRPHPQGASAMFGFWQTHKKTAPKTNSVRLRKNMVYGL